MAYKVSLFGARKVNLVSILSLSLSLQPYIPVLYMYSTAKQRTKRKLFFFLLVYEAFTLLIIDTLDLWLCLSD